MLGDDQRWSEMARDGVWHSEGVGDSSQQLELGRVRSRVELFMLVGGWRIKLGVR